MRYTRGALRFSHPSLASLSLPLPLPLPVSVCVVTFPFFSLDFCRRLLCGTLLSPRSSAGLLRHVARGDRRAHDGAQGVRRGDCGVGGQHEKVDDHRPVLHPVPQGEPLRTKARQAGGQGMHSLVKLAESIPAIAVSYPPRASRAELVLFVRLCFHACELKLCRMYVGDRSFSPAV